MNKTAKFCSIYIHIPFCVSKCYYCDFYSKVTTDDIIKQYCHALVRELEYHCLNNNLGSYTVSTIFFGGGTPSLLSSSDFAYIASELKKRIHLSDNYEWTVECNPDSFSEKLARIYLSAGVNRLSFGIQSLNDSELNLLGRRHSAQKAVDVLNLPVLSDFQSIGADLIYGIPVQTRSSFKQTLDRILKISTIKHLSVYELAINENTPFGRHKKKLPLPDESEIEIMMDYALSSTKKAGFEHYEISNFALPRYHCRHNEVYWDHGNYIGLGTSAHSYIHPVRWANISEISEYVNLCNRKFLPVDFCETITSEKIADELLMLGFRKQSGINEFLFEKQAKKPFCTSENCLILDSLIQKGYITYNKPLWKPTEKGMLFADAIAKQLSV
jgi:oxygen-independent coproporphyrinogen III oxidase